MDICTFVAGASLAIGAIPLEKRPPHMISAILVFIGFLAIFAIGYGVLGSVANGMWDAPSQGDQSGGMVALIGFVVLVAVIAIGIYRR